MKLKLLLGLALVLSGGLFAGCETDRLPSQKGSWFGQAEPLTVYNANGIPHKVLKLSIQQGPKIGDNGYDKGSFDSSKATNERDKERFFSPVVIIVDRNYYAVNPKTYEGLRLKVWGTIEITSAIDPNDKSRLIRITPKYDPNPTESIPAIIRAKQIEIIDSTNTPTSRQP